MTTFAGPLGVKVYTLTALAAGLRLYARTGIKPNRAWTPRNMMAKAEELTEQKFKARDYLGAAKVCSELADRLAPEARATGAIRP